MFIRSLGFALVVTATAHAILLGDGHFVLICEPHMQALKTALLALRHDLNCALLSARDSVRLWAYKHSVIRPAYALDRAQMSVSFEMNEAFVDNWFQPLGGTYCSRSGIKMIAQSVTAAEPDMLVGNERAAFVLKDLCGAVLVVIAPRDAWTHMSLQELVDSAEITARVAQSGGADAYLGSVWIGGTEV